MKCFKISDMETNHRSISRRLNEIGQY